MAAPVRYMTVVSCLLNAASPFSTAEGMFALVALPSELRASSNPKRSFAWKYRRLHALFAIVVRSGRSTGAVTASCKRQQTAQHKRYGTSKSVQHCKHGLLADVPDGSLVPSKAHSKAHPACNDTRQRRAYSHQHAAHGWQSACCKTSMQAVFAVKRSNMLLELMNDQPCRCASIRQCTTSEAATYSGEGHRSPGASCAAA